MNLKQYESEWIVKFNYAFQNSEKLFLLLDYRPGVIYPNNSKSKLVFLKKKQNFTFVK